MISFSRVFLPSSRCSSRPWYCRARYSEVGTTSSPAPTANSAPSAYSRRQVKSWFGATPCCRATSDTDIPGAKVSCTIRAFSSADQRRRRCTDVITSTRSIFPVIDTGILLVLNQGVGPVRCFRGPLHFEHFVAYLGTGFIASLGYARRFGCLVPAVLLCGYAVVLEIGQNWASGSHPDFVD